MSTAIEFNNVSKQYKLGLVSTKTLSHDLNRWWQTKILGKEDPYLKIGSVNDRAAKADSDYVWALKNIDFKVEQGDVVGIIGKNGAGKSTLLKLLSRVTNPTTGTIRARGRIASLLEVGTGFHPELTGRENIYMNGSIMGMSKSEITRKLDEIVDFSGCERYIDTPVKRYSSGMMVRLGFAVAAHLDPEILVVDEVLAVGDAEFQKKAIGKMQDVSKGEGRTVLFVSHNMASMRQLCNSGVLLENGMVKFIGNIREAIETYTTSSKIIGGSVINSIKKCKDTIKIDNIEINNNKTNIVKVASVSNTINVKIEGYIYRSMKIGLELCISDKSGTPVLFFSPHHANSPLINEGAFIIDETMTLPLELMGGDYFADIYLTNSLVEGIVDIPNAFQIELEGCATPNGYQMSYNSNYGFLYLNK